MNNSIINSVFAINTVVAFVCIDPMGKPLATKGMLTDYTPDSQR